MVESALVSQRPAAPSPNYRAQCEARRAVDATSPARIPSIRLHNDAPATGDGDADQAFADSTAWNLGEMVIVREVCPQQSIRRSHQMARADQMDHYQILVSFSGAGISIDADGHQLGAARGEPVVLDLARPAELVLGAGTSVQAFVPREMLDELLPGPRDLHAARLTGASATVLAEHLRSLTTCLPEMTAAQAPHAVTATLHMVAASLASTPQTPQRTRPPIESPLLRQACRYIDLHLKEPGLSVADLCVAMKVSRATLYRMFEAYGGVSNHIRERRLARIRGVLCEGRGRRSLARIAEDHGFENPAHFSRAFRQQYGHCPSDAAATDSGGRSLAATMASAADPLAQWLRSLRG
jgi:AraC-like DNA-binding protein